MTDEQLEKQISEEFEKWWKESKDTSVSFQWLQKHRDNPKKLLDGFITDTEKAFKAAALPLMKKFNAEEEAWLITVKCRDEQIEKLQKENEELKKIDLHSALERIKDLDKYIGELREALKACLAVILNEYDSSFDDEYGRFKEIRTKFNLNKEGGK